MDTDADHYFSSRPSVPAEQRELVVTLGGIERRLVTANGIFSPDRIDQGTQVLLHEVPAPPTEGHLLDLGCGWGPLALTLGLASPGATVWAVDVNERALDLARTNAELLHVARFNACTPEDVPDSVNFSAIWSNPPIRIGKQQLHKMLRRWIPRLATDGEGWFVVQKNLGADSLQRWMIEEFSEMEVTRYATSRGFRLLHVRRAP